MPAICAGIARLVIRLALTPIARLDIEPTLIPPQPHRGVIIASNHRSLLDFFVGVLAFAEWRVAPRLFMRGDLLEIPVLGRVLRKTGALPGGAGYGVASIRAARAALGRGEVLAIAPEGRIPYPSERQNGIAELKPGIGHLAAPLGTPILLTAIIGTDLAWKRGDRLPRIHLNPRRRPTVIMRTAWLEPPRGTTRAEIIAQTRSGLEDLIARNTAPDTQAGQPTGAEARCPG